MRLLQLEADGKLTFTRDLLLHEIRPYAILSHTWGTIDDEVTFQDVIGKKGQDKPGYQKILFCGRQARHDGFKYFWVDTCCIDKTNFTELTEAINSMYQWYQNAEKCYAYLADVSHAPSQSDKLLRSTWKSDFRKSRWFTRGWTLQELIAPRIVEFFSSDGQRLGDKLSLEQTIHEITHIPIRAVPGILLSEFSVEERISWANNRSTSRPEDKAYSLLGILGVFMPLIYGEGEEQALERLRSEFSMRSTQVRVLAKLPIASGSTFDSHAEEHSPRCLPNTRVLLLRDITEWAEDPNTKTVYWLHGMAGTGKSTISRTLAHMFSQKGTLAANFFFKRGEDERGGVARFFTTIASQLVKKLPNIAAGIQSAIDADPAIFSKAMNEQLDRLITEPLSKVLGATATTTLLVIVDALDECNREEDVRRLIKLLSSTKVRQLRLKVFLTSRPELPIRLGFKAISDLYQDFVLHEIAEPVIEHDIAVFLKHELCQIRREYNENVPEERQLPTCWPSHADLQSLVQMAVPLFIFAATVCRFIADRRIGSPDEQLNEILQYQYQSNGRESQLDNTYLPVLNHMISDLSERKKIEVLDRFRNVVGSIIVIAAPLSALALAHLLDMPLNRVMSGLDVFHSVLSVPDSPKRPIRLLHLSFRDFLIDPETSNTHKKYPFLIDEQKTHKSLGVQCLQLLSGNEILKKDICNLKIPGIDRSQISSQVIDASLPPEVEYACRYWVYHQKESRYVINDGDIVACFLSSHLLHWLEALSLLGRISESIGMIDDLLGMIDILDGHSNTVYSVAFSPDGKLIASASGDRTIRLWATNTGQCQQTLEGHSDEVASVVFSPDGKLVASASGDRTVRLWATDTGQCKQTLEGHSGYVSSVVFSLNGKLIASASDDKTVRLWTTDMGQCQQTLEGHNYYVTSVVFSPDSKLIASASFDKTVRLWTADTGQCQQTLEGHSAGVVSVAFSPDGKLVASASGDKTVRLWTTNTGHCQQILEGHGNYISLVVFSPDGNLVASASGDRTVRLWAANTGQHQKTLEGHSDEVISVVFSPDSKLVASASGDKTVRLWAADTGQCQQTLEGHSNYIYSVVFSFDGKLIASASFDRTVRLWTADTGQYQQTLEGHSAEVYSVVFSPDGKLIASASYDETLRIWAADTGQCQQTLENRQPLIMPRFTQQGSTYSLKTGKNVIIINQQGTVDNGTSKKASLIYNSAIAGQYSFDTNRRWITLNGNHLLRLPVDIAPECSAVFSSTVAIGCATGRVMILRFL